MKIKDIVQESVYDWFTQRDAARTQASSQQKDRLDTQQAQAQHKKMIRHQGLSFCGAYWGYGFHEDGVKSALAVCAAFGVDLK